MTKQFGATHMQDNSCGTWFSFVKAFTLAEVLITLGIIGVVAAMTIPTLVQHYQDHVLDTQKKKSSSELSQAFKMMLAHNEVDSLANVPITSCGEDSDCIKAEIGKVLKIVNDNNISALPEKYEFADKEETVWDGYDIQYVFTSPNGATYGIVKMDEDAENVSIIADVNGNKRPNKGAVDLCLFNITKQGIANINCPALTNAENRIACKPGDVSGCADRKTCQANSGIWVFGGYEPSFCASTSQEADEKCKALYPGLNGYFDGYYGNSGECMADSTPR